MTKDVVSKILDIDFVPEEPKKEIEVVPETPKKVEIIETSSGLDPDEEDFELVRSTLRNLIRQGNLKLEEMGELSNELETARGYEVYSTMMEKISGLTKDLYDLHKKKKDLKTKDEPERKTGTNVNVDKAVFVGTTAELLKQIKGKKEDEEETPNENV